MKRPALRIVLIILIGGVLLSRFQTSASNGNFTLLATSSGIADIRDAVIGGPPGNQKLYVSYFYSDAPVEIMAVNPTTGSFQVASNPPTSELDVESLVAGPDGNVYGGTTPGGRLLKINTTTNQITDLGKAIPTETIIFDLAVASDNNIYFGTYPYGRLGRYNPTTGTIQDLGQMDTTQPYGISVAANNDGFVYVGLGYTTPTLVAYNIATGEHRTLLQGYKEQTSGSAGFVYKDADGQMYASIGPYTFMLNGFNTPQPTTHKISQKWKTQLADGRTAAINGTQVNLCSGQSCTSVPYTYSGRPTTTFRLGVGPNNSIYSTGASPISLQRIDPNGGSTVIGNIGSGQAYSLQSWNGKLLIGAYGGLSYAPLMRYDPTNPYSTSAPANPALVNFLMPNGNWQSTTWRPYAQLLMPDGKIVIAAEPEYGHLYNGRLYTWDPSTDNVQVTDNLVNQESIVSLTLAADSSHRPIIVAGTSIRGGSASNPTQTDAKLVIIDPATKQPLFETIPVPGKTFITDLVTAPDGNVYGIADQNSLFVFNPQTREVVSTSTLTFNLRADEVLYNSAALGADGNIWGLAENGIFKIIPSANTPSASLVDTFPAEITAGFAMVWPNLYFASGTNIYQYAILNASTPTPTPTPTPTITPTPTPTPSPTFTPTPTPTSTSTPTPTPTLIWIPTPTPSPSSTPVPRIKLIRSPSSPKVYYVTEKGYKRWIPTAQVFLSYGNQWQDVKTLSQSEINAIPDDFLIKGPTGPKIYKLENGKKRWVTTLAAFNRNNFSWDMVAPVNQTELNSYPLGPNFQ